MQNLFDRLFTYRQLVEHRTPLENFTTEIFAYCLKSDTKFRENFFRKLNIECKNFEIETQYSYEKFGIPDIQIISDNSVILVECKVNSTQGETQLDRYQKILTTFYPDKEIKKIVFLTKIYESIDNIHDLPNIEKLRWFEVSRLIENDNIEITKEFNKFLKSNSMGTDYSFKDVDFDTMKTISTTIEKMDEVLNTISDKFKKSFGAISQPASRSSRLENNLYNNFVELWFKDDTRYWLLVGFFWWWADNQEPCVGLSFQLPSRKSKQMKLDENLEHIIVKKLNYKLQDDGDFLYFYKCKQLSEFKVFENRQTSEIVNYVNTLIDELEAIKNENTELFKRQGSR